MTQWVMPPCCVYEAKCRVASVVSAVYAVWVTAFSAVSRGETDDSWPTCVRAASEFHDLSCLSVLVTPILFF